MITKIIIKLIKKNPKLYTKVLEMIKEDHKADLIYSMDFDKIIVDQVITDKEISISNSLILNCKIENCNVSKITNNIMDKCIVQNNNSTSSSYEPIDLGGIL